MPRRRASGWPTPIAGRSPKQELELRESATEVRAALDELPAAQRLALTLHYFEDQRYEDIAEVMDLPLNTVKSFGAGRNGWQWRSAIRGRNSRAVRRRG